MHVPRTAPVDCIIVNYHCAPLTIRAARSFTDQCPLGQLIVVDNSVDRDQQALLRAQLPSVSKLVVEPANRGFGAACNAAFQASNHDAVLLLNPDALLMPGCLDELASCLAENPRAAAVSPLQFWNSECTWMLPPAWLPTGRGQWALAAAMTCKRQANRLSHAYRRLALWIWANAPARFVPQRALSGAAMLVRRDAIVSVGKLFDPRYFMYYEDSDLCLRLCREGWSLAVAPRARLLHEWIHSDDKVRMMEESRKLYFAANFDGHGLWKRCLDRLADVPPLSNPLEASPLPRGTPYLAVPRAWQQNWLLEASPSALMIPSVGRAGVGPRAPLDWTLLERMGPGPVHLRLGPLAPVRGDTRAFRCGPRAAQAAGR